jgi:hypothetical protein
MRMPKLETMTLWNGLRGKACSFTYSRRYASITWRGTWELELEGSTLDAWGPLRRVEKLLITDEIHSHGDAIRYLGLQSVVDNVSLQQIPLESSQV